MCKSRVVAVCNGGINSLHVFARYQSAFHNVDLTSLREAAVQEYFKQPIVV